MKQICFLIQYDTVDKQQETKLGRFYQNYIVSFEESDTYGNAVFYMGEVSQGVQTIKIMSYF